MKTKGLDLAGCVFGRWSVLSRAEKRPGSNYSQWLCRCSCGTLKVVASKHLHGNSRSCGCLAVESVVARSRTHGMVGSRTYSSWTTMKVRCTSPQHRSFENYGGRGIVVCDRWKNSFENFLSDMGPRPDGRTLDRIDNDGNYEPGNCRWAPEQVQRRNKRNTVYLEVFGEKISLPDAAERFGVPSDQLRWRLKKGWSMEAAVTTALQRRGPRRKVPNVK